jgi:hypothetical protein
VTISATKPSEEEGAEPDTETMLLTFEGTNTFKMAPEGSEGEAIYFTRAQ